MSLSVNQVEAPSHIEVVCFGHGAPNQADNTSPNQSFLRTVRASLCIRISQSPCMCESMITSFLIVPCHVVTAELAVITRQRYMIEL